VERKAWEKAMTKGTMRLLDPVAQADSGDQPLAPRSANLDGKVMGFLSNGWKSLQVLYPRLQALAAGHCQLAGVVVAGKRDISQAPEPEVMQKLRQGCDAVVNGLGN